MGDDKTKLLQALTIDRTEARPAAARVRLWPWLTVAAVAVLALGSAFLITSRPTPTDAAQSPPPPTQKAAAPEPAVAPPEPERGRLVASGYIVARRKATVAAEITGKVVEVMIEEGMVVQAGQVVAKLDSVLAEHDLALAQSRAAAADAAVAAIAADLQDAERIFERARSLSRSNFVSDADLTKAEARVGVLRAQLAQSKAQLETARVDAQRAASVLDKHSIRAPFAGVVVERSAQPGEMISPMSAGGSFTRTGICTIVDMDSIEIEVDVNEAFIGRVRPGGAVTAALDAYPNWAIPATVIAVVPTANRDKATVKVRIALKQKDPRILPDMAVKVTFLDADSAADAAARQAAN
jgi:HlyD family secretion protein